MNKRDFGFAMLLMGILFGVPGDTAFWYIGFVLGLIGLVFVFLSGKKK